MRTNYPRKYKACILRHLKHQVSLHTGVYYVNVDNQIKRIPFATASDLMWHEPAAIWQQLQPILSEICEEYPWTAYISLVMGHVANTDKRVTFTCCQRIIFPWDSKRPYRTSMKPAMAKGFLMV